MPSSRCVVQGCCNPSNPKEGISLHNSPVNPSLRAQWKRFISAHRANFNPPGRFVVCPEHFTDDCFARTINVGGAMKRLQPYSVPTIWRKKDIEPSTSSCDRRMVSVYHMLFPGFYLCILSMRLIFIHDLSVLYKTDYWLSKLSSIISLVYVFSLLQNQSVTL